MSKNTKQTILPLIIAAIWGLAFIAQSVASDYVGTFTFNFARSIVATIALSPVAFYFYKKNGLGEKTISSGLIIGVVLGWASCLQQAGIETTTAGKAAFITAMYIVLVPIVGVFQGHRPDKRIIFALISAVVGLYLLCVNESFFIGKGDLLVILCAFTYTLQIVLIDYYAPKSNEVVMSFFMFVSMTVFCFIGMILFEEPSIEALKPCISSILYAGVFSSGVAYTLQIVAQKGTNPVIVSMLMSMESVFALLFGALILNERLSTREIIGCIVMLLAIIICKLPKQKKKIPS